MVKLIASTVLVVALVAGLENLPFSARSCSLILGASSCPVGHVG
jgi:hypothetical protein